jgi:hypothetical protein
VSCDVEILDLRNRAVPFVEWRAMPLPVGPGPAWLAAEVRASVRPEQGLPGGLTAWRPGEEPPEHTVGEIRRRNEFEAKSARRVPAVNQDLVAPHG